MYVCVIYLFQFLWSCVDFPSPIFFWIISQIVSVIFPPAQFVSRNQMFFFIPFSALIPKYSPIESLRKTRPIPIWMNNPHTHTTQPKKKNCERKEESEKRQLKSINRVIIIIKKFIWNGKKGVVFPSPKFLVNFFFFNFLICFGSANFLSKNSADHFCLKIPSSCKQNEILLAATTTTRRKERRKMLFFQVCHKGHVTFTTDCDRRNQRLLSSKN